MSKIPLLFFLLCAGLPSLSQTVKIKGSVDFDKENADCIYNTLIYALGEDTLLVAGDVFFTKQFEVEVPRHKAYLVRLSSMGYKDIELYTPAKDATADLGSLRFITDPIQLGEVVIAAKQPLVKMKAEKLVIHIRNTTLSDAGSVMEMLKRTPGIIPSGENSLRVPGRGEPLIIVDNQEIKNKDILQSIRSSDVASVEIDRMPSSAYAANVKAVIRIKTVQHLKDNLYLKIAHTLSANHKWSAQPSLQFKIKKGLLASMLTYGYSDMNHVIHEDYYKYIYHPDYTFSSLSQAKQTSNHQLHRILWGTDLDINKKNRIGIQYFYQHSDRKGHTYNQNHLADKAAIWQRTIDQANDLSGNLHSISLNYTYAIHPASSLIIVTDYASRANQGVERTDETHAETGQHARVDIFNHTRYDIFTYSTNYKTLLPYAVQANFGYQYAHVRNPSRVTTCEGRNNGKTYEEHIRLKDQIHAGFIHLAKEFKNLTLQVGLRYEYAQTEIKTLAGGGEEANVSRSYSDFFPHLEMAYQVNEDWGLSLNVARHIDRPSFGELNPSVFYEDSLSYISGNPWVKPSYNQEISIGTDWKNLSFSLSYAHCKNARVQTFIKDEDPSNITRMTPINLDKSQGASANLMYAFTRNKISIYSSIGADLPLQEVPYLDRIRKIRKLAWHASINCEYAINDKFKLHGDFFYNSANESLLTYQYSTNALNIGLRIALLKNKLIMDIYGTDLLQGSNFNNVYDKYLNIYSGTRGKGDFRGIKFSVSYVLFNSDKISIKSQRGNASLLDRTN